MSFDKSYANRKDYRKSYYDSRAFDCNCRAHGSCSWCRGNRKRFDKRARIIAEEKLEEDWRDIENARL